MWIRLLAWMLADEEPSLPAPGDLLAGAEGGHAGAECVLDTGMGRFHVKYAGWASDVDPGSRA